MTLGLGSGIVELHRSYDEWVRDYARALAEMALEGIDPACIDHVGSTAVPNLSAKPIVDIVVGAGSRAEIPHLVRALAGIGYEYGGFREEAGGEILCYKIGNLTARHVHVVPKCGKQWLDYIAFRDYLRASHGARETYEVAKMAFARRYPRDRRRYTAAKAEVIRLLLEEAVRLRTQRGE